ncbi:reverse transcriptase domain-containing protein [Tanacetum coccineum]
MCVDFTDLNKSCPKDCYPFSEIDWKIESLYGYLFKCFMDAYKGYHQIQMAEEDEEKTVFHTSQGVYYYIKMSFGIKNAGATYQWLMDKAFEKQIRTNLEVYVDDLVIKSHTEPEILRDIEKSDFQWTAEAEKAFQEMKQHIAELPMLTTPKPREELIMYLCAAREAISAVLLIERDSKKMPIYLVSRTLQTPEINYSPMEKLILARVHTTRRLRRYFQAYPIVVITYQPIKQILSWPENAGRMAK